MCPSVFACPRTCDRVSLRTRVSECLSSFLTRRLTVGVGLTCMCIPFFKKIPVRGWVTCSSLLCHHKIRDWIEVSDSCHTFPLVQAVAFF